MTDNIREIVLKLDQHVCGDGFPLEVTVTSKQTTQVGVSLSVEKKKMFAVLSKFCSH